jgi:hypothetical protein
MKGFALLLITALMLSTATLNAQILIGPVAGPQVSWVSYDRNSDSKGLYKQTPVYGFHAGVGVSFRVHKRFFLNTAFLYSTKGKYLEGKDDPLLKFQAKYNYIDVPMIYTVEFLHKVGKVKQYKFFFGIGPNVSYWLNSKGYIENSQLNEMIIDRVKYKAVFDKEEGDFNGNQMNVNNPNRWQFGLNFATGFVFEPLGYQKVMLTIRYELGGSYLSPNNPGQFTLTNEYKDDLRIHIQGIRLSLSYLVDLRNEDSKKGKSTINKRRLH